MAARIRVVDEHDKPVKGARVIINWGGGAGSSDGWTQDDGVYDTGFSGGTISSISIDGKYVNLGYLVDEYKYVRR